MSELKKMKCFWCGRKYADLIGHCKRQHPGLDARSYDANKSSPLINHQGPSGSAMFNQHISPIIMEQVRGISTKRTAKIEEMMLKNIPDWKRYLMKNVPKMGIYFRYAIKIEVQQSKETEIANEKIVLMHHKKEVDSIVFIATEAEGPDLMSFLPRTKPPKIDYVG